MPTIQCDGADCYYEDRGEGPPVVLLHGAMAGLRFFEPQLAGLSDAHRTIALDFRGHGRSEKTASGHTVAGYARDLDAFLDGLSLDGVVLVGWSMGALVAWEYVDRFGPERVRAIVDVDMEPTAFQWDDYAHGTIDLAGLRNAVGAIQSDHLRFVEDLVEPLLAAPPSPSERRLIFDEASRCPPSVKSSLMLDYTFRDYRDRLPSLDVPTLVCAGADEAWRSVASVELVSELVPRARFELFEDSGHCPTIEEPERFDRVVRAFLEGV